MIVLKKDLSTEIFSYEKIMKAVEKSSKRVLKNISKGDILFVAEQVGSVLEHLKKEVISVEEIHNAVEIVLDKHYPDISKSYKDYRNYKKDFVHMMDDVFTSSQSIRYIGDKSNGNTDSTLVATKRSLIFNELNKQLYRKFFMTTEELQACKDGYIYIHDQSSRLDTINCCLFDIENVLNGGFEMGNIWYNEPTKLSSVFGVIGDIILCTASQQYGGFTLCEIDKVLSKYAEKSYQKYRTEYIDILSSENVLASEKTAHEFAISKVKNDFKQGFQEWEYKLNTVGSSRGDYPFVTMTFGLGIGLFEKMASSMFLEVHKGGQGADGFKKPVLFPKLVFLYDEELHGNGGLNEDLFLEAIDCSSKTMYPDYLSLTGDGYVADMYKNYKRVISPMG